MTFHDLTDSEQRFVADRALRISSSREWVIENEYASSCGDLNRFRKQLMGDVFIYSDLVYYDGVVVSPRVAVEVVRSMGASAVRRRLGELYPKKMLKTEQDCHDFILAFAEFESGEPVSVRLPLGSHLRTHKGERPTILTDWILHLLGEYDKYKDFIQKIDTKNLPEDIMREWMRRLLLLDERFCWCQWMKSESLLTRMRALDGDNYFDVMRNLLPLCNGMIPPLDAFLDNQPTSTCGAVAGAVRALGDGRPDIAARLLVERLGKNGLCFDTPLYNLVLSLSLYVDNPKENHGELLRDIIEHRSRIPNMVVLAAVKGLGLDVKDYIDKYYFSNLDLYANVADFLLFDYFGLTANMDKAKRAKRYSQAKGSQFLFVRCLYAEIHATDERETLERQLGTGNILPKLRTENMWETRLSQIIALCEKKEEKKKKPTTASVKRVAYNVGIDSEPFFSKEVMVQPKVQTSKDGGLTWTRGRDMSLKTFKDGIPEQTQQDRAVSRCISTPYYSFNTRRALLELVGHPYIFRMDAPDVKVEIVSEQPQVAVTKSEQGFVVKTNIDVEDSNSANIYFCEESQQRINVVKLTDNQRQIFLQLQRIKTLPAESEPMLKRALAVLGQQATVMTDVVEQKSADVKQGDTTIVVQLMPVGQDIRMRLYVKPFTDVPPYCKPGEGLERVASKIKGKPVQAQRDLDKERKNLVALTDRLAQFDEWGDDDGWQLPPEACLTLLSMLREMNDVRVEWPEGVKYKVSYPVVTPDNVKLSVGGVGAWFEVKGEVKIGKRVKMKVAELLQRLNGRIGNFVEMGDGEFLALSDQLRRQLDQIGRMVMPAEGRSKNLRLSPFSVVALKELADSGADVEADEKYNQLISRIDEAYQQEFALPKTLQADLRDYQAQAFQWMARLAHWGAGACLADDMGLGKTVEAIAMLLLRANQGAQLVVAPTSVMPNWGDELARFAPSLRVLVLHDQQTDRKAIVEEAADYDIVLTTYGLLITEASLLASRKWTTIVLDEAHTIKNRTTKMSHSAMQLHADFRLILTGTPLQNHLSEIWNLYEFINPGLLGSFQQFTDRFILPIEKQKDKERQRMLKRIVQPFLLRRTKNEVLSQLPEKTEITLKVNLSPEEMALYENLRLKAIAQLEEGSATAMDALAEITRLRQAACNPRLIDPKLSILSTKSQEMMRLVDELTQAGHRALVFSQFTAHLALIRQQLDDEKIDYLYLDGSTPAAQRARLVKKFQTGDTPLFLISLKAGGLGLNLTAADYVIHLDPWWNPAVEDQASDRAYRIGQQKPVTVYRIIAAHTIEERILQLHQTKKSLADALLEGSDMATQLSREQMLELILGSENLNEV